MRILFFCIFLFTGIVFADSPVFYNGITNEQVLERHHAYWGNQWENNPKWYGPLCYVVYLNTRSYFLSFESGEPPGFKSIDQAIMHYLRYLGRKDTGIHYLSYGFATNNLFNAYFYGASAKLPNSSVWPHHWVSKFNWIDLISAFGYSYTINGGPVVVKSSKLPYIYVWADQIDQCKSFDCDLEMESMGLCEMPKPDPDPDPELQCDLYTPSDDTFVKVIDDQKEKLNSWSGLSFFGISQTGQCPVWQFSHGIADSVVVDQQCGPWMQETVYPWVKLALLFGSSFLAFKLMVNRHD